MRRRHDILWSQGGPTDLANGRLLCPYHHGRAHSPAYQIEHLVNGKVWTARGSSDFLPQSRIRV